MGEDTQMDEMEDMKGLLRALDLRPGIELELFVGILVGFADGSPDRPVGEAVHEAFDSIEKMRQSGETDMLVMFIQGPGLSGLEGSDQV